MLQSTHVPILVISKKDDEPSLNLTLFCTWTIVMNEALQPMHMIKTVIIFST